MKRGYWVEEDKNYKRFHLATSQEISDRIISWQLLENPHYHLFRKIHKKECSNDIKFRCVLCKMTLSIPKIYQINEKKIIIE